MRITGVWQLCGDGITRPLVGVKVRGADGKYRSDRFLIDSGADATVFSADLFNQLQFPGSPAPQHIALQGVGGVSPYVVVQTELEFTRDDGGVMHFQGQFSAFTDPTATDLSILGRDVLNHFDIILSRRRNEVLLLAGNHQYHVT